jgi:hypothetical protein
MKILTHESSFRVTDCLLLVAASAAGFAMSRVLASDITPEILWEVLTTKPGGGWSVHAITGLLVNPGAQLVIPCLTAWTFAYLLMQFRGQRTPFRRLVRSPGVMACFVAAMVMGITAGAVIAGLALMELNNDQRNAFIFMSTAFGVFQAGTAVLWSWFAMAFYRRCYSEQTWLDRAGKGLGLSWILIATIYFYEILTSWLQ